MDIKIVEDDITQVDVDAVVNPANSYGYMGGGVAGALKKEGGVEIETEAASHAPIMIGDAVLTTGGKLACRQVIHAPTMEQPGGSSILAHVSEALNAALQKAEEEGFERIAIPGMGTGVGGLPKDKVAEAMIDVLVNFDFKVVTEIMLVDVDKAMVKAWSSVYEGK
tara:strand:- start:714 stop:1211 length:498 start_codon:yes stop_codon:yes gene_type:complete